MLKLNLQMFGGGIRKGSGGGEIRIGGPVRRLPITDSLDEWEKGGRMTNPNVEYAGVFDRNGNPIDAFKGNESSVGVPKSVLNIPDGILTHNHPDKYFGGTFSNADVRLLANSNLSQIRATETNKGDKTTYIIRARGDANRKALASFVKGKEKFMQRNFEKSYDSAKTRAENGRVPGVNPNNKAQVASYARKFAVGKMNNYWKKNLDKFGFDYVVKKSTASSGFSSRR